MARRARQALPWIGFAVALAAVLALAIQAVLPTHAAPSSHDAAGSAGGTPGAASGGSTSSVAPTPAASRSASEPGHESPSPRAPRWEPFATVDELRLSLPAPRPVAVTYHEASRDEALALRPLGHLRHNYNRYKFHPPRERAGPAYIVMSSRGRSQAATSAADIVLRRGTPVRAPVDGRVVGLRRYRLYCRYPDIRVAIEPAGRPDLRLVMLHLTRVRVHRGEPVFATLSVIGRPRPFPFRSQVDDYLTGGNPHVHIEVEKPSPTPVPACPARRG